MDTPLQGPDGKQAQDMRGTPLTMEEMLRRNGIVRMGNTTSMIGPGGATNSTPPNPNAAAAALQANASAAGGPSSGGPVDPSMATSPAGAPNSVDNTNPEAAAQALAATNADPNTVDTLEKLGMIAAGTGAAYMAYRAMHQQDATAIDPTATAMAEPIRGRDGIQDAEFVDAPSTRKQLKARNNTATKIEGGKPPLAIDQQRKLPAPSNRMSTAQALQQRAMQGQPNDMAPIAAPPPVNTVNEAPEEGLARFIGKDSALVKMLKTNPGLMRTLSRVP